MYIHIYSLRIRKSLTFHSSQHTPCISLNTMCFCLVVSNYHDVAVNRLLYVSIWFPLRKTVSLHMQGKEQLSTRYALTALTFNAHYLSRVAVDPHLCIVHIHGLRWNIIVLRSTLTSCVFPLRSVHTKSCLLWAFGQ